MSPRRRLLRAAAATVLAAATGLGLAVVPATGAAAPADAAAIGSAPDRAGPAAGRASTETGPAGSVATTGSTPGSTDASVMATDRSIRCARAGSDAGWTGSTLVTAVAVALAESWCTANATHANPPDASCPYGSTDRGAWQINDCYWDNVSDACAFELYCNARAAKSIHACCGWTMWTTYNNGAYRSYLSEAQAGVDAIGGGTGVYGTVTTGSNSEVLYVRAGPSTTYNVVGSLANGTQVKILCQVRGQWIYSDVYHVWTDLWDKIGTGRYVSDAYVYTGSDGQVAPTC